MGEIKVFHVLEATTGGTRRHVVDVLTHLDRRRCTPLLACSVRRDPAFEMDIQRLRRDGISTFVIPMKRSISPVSDAMAYMRLRALFRRERPDLVHTHSSKAGMLGRAAAAAEGIGGVVHTAHVFAFATEAPRLARSFYSALERWAARRTDRIICVCEAERAAAAEARVGREEQIVVIPNGVDVAEIEEGARRVPGDEMRRKWGLSRDALAVGLVGRMVPQKGWRDFVRAASEVRRTCPRAVFLAVGGGEQRRSIEAWIRRDGLTEVFRIGGQTEEVYSYLAALDVFVLPSHWEGLPYSLLEAMALRRAVVATRVGGVPEVVSDGVNGLLVAPGDPSGMARAILELVNDPVRRMSMGEAGRAAVAERFRRSEMIARLENLYSELARSVEAPEGGQKA